MARIEEFTQDGKAFIYFDMSYIKTNVEFNKIIESAKEFIAKHAQHSVYTITNVEGVMYDTETKNMAARWLEHNKPFVKYGAVIGIDGIKKIMISAIMKLSGRTNLCFHNTKDQAIAWLLAR